MARLKDRLMDARLARSLAILIIVTLALYALTAVAFHHLFATQIGEVRNLAYSPEGQHIGSWQTFRPTPITAGREGRCSRNALPVRHLAAAELAQSGRLGLAGRLQGEDAGPVVDAAGLLRPCACPGALPHRPLTDTQALPAMLRLDRTQGQLLHGLWTRIHTQVPIMRSGLF